MGKREFVIQAFVVVGMAVYPARRGRSRASTPGFSLSQKSRRRGAIATPHLHEPPSQPSCYCSRLSTPELELRLSGLVKVNVVGEVREDVAWTLVDSDGADEAAVQRTAESHFRFATIISATSWRCESGQRARCACALDLKVPAPAGRAGGKRTQHPHRRRDSDVRLENLVGDTEMLRGGRVGVSGAHRNGKLHVKECGSVNLTLVSSEASLIAVRGETSLSIRNGTTRVERGARHDERRNEFAEPV